MPLYRGVQVSQASDVDLINKTLIREIVGDVDEEFKLHRQAMKCFLMLLLPHRFSRGEVLSLAAASEGLIDKYNQVEDIVSEGRRFKMENF